MRPALVWAVSLCAACGGPKKPTPTEEGTSLGAKVTMRVDASGGTVASGDGRFSLEFPPGALASDTEVGIEPITSTAPLGRGTAYRLTPDGAQFLKPVKLKFRFTADDHLGASKEALRIGYQDEGGLWHTWTQNTRNDAAGTITSETTHFTDTTLLLGWQLVPFQATVPLLSQLELRLKYCLPEQISEPEGELSGLTPRCDLEDAELPRLVTVNDWAVNGRSGGSSRDGAIANRGRQGTYTAPNAAPPNNPVAVSCRFTNPQSTNLAVTNVFIGKAGWAGSVTWTLGGMKSEAMGEYMRRWTVSGNGAISVRPGANDLPAIDSASSTWRHQYDEVVNQTYTQGACMHSVTQTTTETLTGTSSMNASLLISTEGTTNTVVIGVPTGGTTGSVIVDATDSVTGNGCTSPMPTHTVRASTGTIPGDVLVLTVTGTDRLNGSRIVSIAGTPPRDYSVSFDLAR